MSTTKPHVSFTDLMLWNLHPPIYISYISNCSSLHLRAKFCEHHPLRLYLIVIIYYYSHIYRGRFLTSLSAFSFSFSGPHFQIKFPSNILRKLNKVNLMMPIINLIIQWSCLASTTAIQFSPRHARVSVSCLCHFFQLY